MQSYLFPWYEREYGAWSRDEIIMMFYRKTRECTHRLIWVWVPAYSGRGGSKSLFFLFSYYFWTSSSLLSFFLLIPFFRFFCFFFAFSRLFYFVDSPFCFASGIFLFLSWSVRFRFQGRSYGGVWGVWHPPRQVVRRQIWEERNFSAILTKGEKFCKSKETKKSVGKCRESVEHIACRRILAGAWWPTGTREISR